MEKLEIQNHIKNILRNKKEKITGERLPSAQNAAFNKFSVAWVTSIAIDIRKYKKQMEYYDRAKIINLLQAFTSAVIKVGKENENFISAYTNGDEVILNFSAGTKQDITKNVSTATAINSVTNYLLRDELKSMGYDWGKFEAGIGVWTSFNNSLVRYGEKGSQEESYHTIIGDSINYATHLAKLANKGARAAILFNWFTFNNLLSDKYKDWALEVSGLNVGEQSVYDFGVYNTTLI